MAIIHKLVESGAEAYLPFLLARERVIRRQRSDGADGSMSGGYSVKYEFGDITAELRMVGNQSFVRLTLNGGSNVFGNEWVAFFANANLQYTEANNVQTYQGPETSKRPVGPTMTPYPDPPLLPPPNPADYPLSEYVDSATGVGYLQSAMVGIAKTARAILEPLVREYYDFFSPPDIDPVWKENQIQNALNNPGNGGGRDGIKSGGFNHDTGYATPIYTPGDDIRIDRLIWEVASGKAYRSWNDGAKKHHESFEAAYAQWAATTLREWELKNLPSLACPPYYVELLPKQISGRTAQLAAFQGELLAGLNSLTVAIPALHPDYFPLESPTEPFATDSGYWTDVGVYASRPSESITREYLAPKFATCGDAAQANVYVNAYASSVVGGVNSTGLVSKSQAYGYRVDGTAYTRDNGSPAMTTMPLASYEDWLDSPRTPLGSRVSFDLVYGDAPGKMCIALFEFYAYDYKTDQWMWTPSLPLLDNEPINSCYSICYSYPDHEREAKYTNRPEPTYGSCTEMRSYAFLVHQKTPTGWGAPTVVAAPQISLDVSEFGRGAMPHMWCATVGLQKWMTPAFPNPGTVVGKDFMSKATVTAPNPGGTMDEAMTWIHAQCLSRFNIPFN